jgi:signal transduction histidine kinase
MTSGRGPHASTPGRMAGMRPERWLQVAGFGTWGATVIPAVAGVLDGRLSGGRLALWSCAAAVFLGAFAGFTRNWPACRPPFSAASLLALQTVATLAMVGAGRDTLAAGVLLVVVAGQLPGLFTASRASLWVAVQTAALVWVFSLFMSPLPATTYGLAFGGFQLFALGAGALARRERLAREALGAANAELLATRALMAENSRVAERLRISRDLHDTLGHHLTALSLQLEVASRLADGKAVEHVRQAHAITRLLLADVRNVVGQLRESSRFDLAQAVHTLVTQSSTTLAIHVEAPETLPAEDDARAHILLRCVQEIVTNATRHAQARNLWLAFASGPDGLTVSARDDGRGATHVTWGHGLTGMRERFEAHAGHVEVRTNPGHGFEVRAFLPRERDPS